MRPWWQNVPPFGAADGMTAAELGAVHARWIRRNGPWASDAGPRTAAHRLYTAARQCGGCAFYVPLRSQLGFDWGACANPKSPFDGRLVFEHHACPQIVQRTAPGFA